MRAKKLRVVAICLVLSLVVGWAVPGQAGLIAEWQFEGNGNDSVGAASGTLVNGPAFAPGVFGQAVVLNGGNQYMTVPAIGNGYTALTISTWVYLTSNQPTFGTIFDDDVWTTSNVHYAFRGDLANRPAFSVCGTPDQFATFGPAPGAWHLVTASYDTAVKNVAFFIDNAAAGTVTYASPLPINLTAAAIGAWNANGASPQRYLYGQLDDFAIWSNALTPGRALALCNVPRNTDLTSYDAKAMNMLFDVYDSGAAATLGTLTWIKSTSLTGHNQGDAWTDANGYYVQLDASGGGVTTSIPKSRTWTGNAADGNWRTTANWDLVPSGGETLVFAGSKHLTDNSNNFDFNTLFAGITFDSTAGAFTLAGARITLAGDVVNNSPAEQTISLPLVLSTGSRTFNAASGSLVLSGALTGNGGIIKTGTNTLTLNAVAGYSGSTTVNAGTLKLGVAQAIPSGVGTGNLTVNGTLDLAGFDQTVNGLSGNGTVTNSGLSGTNTLALGGADASSTFSGTITDGGAGAKIALVKAGAGTVALTNTNAYSAGTTINAGVLSIPEEASLGDPGFGLTFGGGLLGITGTACTSIGRTIYWGAAGSGFDIADAANTFTLTQDVSGGPLTKAGAGVLVLAGSNNIYAGGTVLKAGALAVDADAKLGEASGALIFNGGLLRILGTQYQSTPRTITWGAAGGGFEVADVANTFTVSQTLSGPGPLTKAGPGTMVLEGNHDYTGATTVNGGTLQLGEGASLSATSVISVGPAAAASLTLAGGTVHQVGGAGTERVYVGGRPGYSGGQGVVTHTGGAFQADGNMFLAYNLGDTGEYNLSGDASLQVQTILFTRFGNATINQSGSSTLTCGQFVLGEGGGGASIGAYNLSGGTFHQVGGAGTNRVYIGGDYWNAIGHAVVNQTGGAFQTDGNMFLTWIEGDVAEYNLSGDGSLQTQMLYTRFGNATITQSDSTSSIACTHLILGEGGGGTHTGTYNLSGGTFRQSGGFGEFRVYVGGDPSNTRGHGIVNQTGGSFQTDGSMALAWNAGDVGSYSISAADSSLTVAGDLALRAGNAVIDHAAGAVEVGAALRIGEGDASTTAVYNLSGGELRASAITQGTNTGTHQFNFSGGTIRPSTASGLTVSGVPFTLTGNSNTLAASLSDGTASDVTVASPVGGDGGLVKTGDGTLTLSGANKYAGPTKITAGTLRLAPTLPDAPHNLAALYRFEATATTDIDGSMKLGAFHGQTFTGTAVGPTAPSVVADAPGTNGGTRSLALDGSQYVDLPAILSAVNPFRGSGTINGQPGGDYTITAWFKVAPQNRGVSSDRVILSSGRDATPGNHAMAFFLASGPRSGGVGDLRTDNYCVNAQAVGGDRDDGAWHFGAVTYQRATNSFQVFVDDQASAVKAFDPAIPNAQFDIIRIGGTANWDYPRPANFVGNLDDVAIFQGILSAAELAAVRTGDFSAYLYGGIPVANGLPATSDVTISGGATLDLADCIATIGSLTGDAGSAVLLGTGQLTAGGNGAHTEFKGAITGDGSLVKAGDGTMVLSGINEYAGGTTVSGGTLQIASVGALPSGGSLVIGEGGAVALSSGLSAAGSAQRAGSPVPVPEPSSLVLVAAGLAVPALAGGLRLLASRQRRRGRA